MRYPMFAAALALLAVSSSASAQQVPVTEKVPVGMWTGTIQPPGSETAKLTYDVAYAGDTLKVVINAGEHGTFQTTEAKFEGGKISFKFRPGPELVCVLSLSMGEYAGVCTDNSGEAAPIVMTPPKAEPVKK